VQARRTRKLPGGRSVREVYVSWLGYPDNERFNMWIPEDATVQTFDNAEQTAGVEQAEAAKKARKAATAKATTAKRKARAAEAAAAAAADAVPSSATASPVEVREPVRQGTAVGSRWRQQQQHGHARHR